MTLDWRVFLTLSICWFSAESAVQAADLKQQVDSPPSQLQKDLGGTLTIPGEPVQEKPKPLDTIPVLPAGTSPDPESATLPIKYWGNSFSLKFHRPSCPFAKAMSAHHVMFFNFRRQAVDSGQVPCRYCLPPNWTTVRASIWHPAELSKLDSPMPERNSQSSNVSAVPTQIPNQVPTQVPTQAPTQVPTQIPN
ncbi:MAG: hypothetical protein HYX67_12020 [Candidatus Melainabacteria bacterium]|nr:hypothetical protein [Candidatus Melainabacteria bacterium]